MVKCALKTRNIRKSKLPAVNKSTEKIFVSGRASKCKKISGFVIRNVDYVFRLAIVLQVSPVDGLLPIKKNFNPLINELLSVAMVRRWNVLSVH